MVCRNDFYYLLTIDQIFGLYKILVLLRAISKNYNKEYLPPEKYVNLLYKRFSPYCSVATWYLWRSIDPEPIQY